MLRSADRSCFCSSREAEACGLLPQPGGFEGTRPVLSEVGPPDGLAIVERPHVPDESLNLGAAHLAAAAEADQHKHLVARVDQLFKFQTRSTGPRRIEVAIEGAHFIGPRRITGLSAAAIDRSRNPVEAGSRLPGRRG